MIVVDTNFLVFLIDPDSTPDGNRNADRICYFVDELEKSKEQIIIPAPSLTELVAGRAERVEEVIDTVKGLKNFLIQEFDMVIAIQAGELIAAIKSKIPETQRLPGWKVAMKYDAMIAATAMVRGARALYTSDSDMSKYLSGSGVKVIRIENLPLPPEDPQQHLDL